MMNSMWTALVEPRMPMADRSGTIQTIPGDKFADLVLSGEGPIVVEFMSYGCRHCRYMEPVLQEVAAMLRTEVRFFRLDAAFERSLAADYAINGTPTIVMFLDGKVVRRLEGPEPSLESLLSSIRRPFEL